MSEKDVLTYWTVGLVVATALAALAAALLITTLRTAQQIERSTGAAQEVIKSIREQTEITAEVEQANQLTRELNALAESFLARVLKMTKTQPGAEIPRGKAR